MHDDRLIGVGFKIQNWIDLEETTQPNTGTNVEVIFYKFSYSQKPDAKARCQRIMKIVRGKLEN